MELHKRRLLLTYTALTNLFKQNYSLTCQISEDWLTISHFFSESYLEMVSDWSKCELL